MLIQNRIMAGSLVWECKHCKEVFLFVDVGEGHEKTCNGVYQPSTWAGYEVRIFATNVDGKQAGYIKNSGEYIKNFSDRNEMFEILNEILIFWKEGKPSEILIRFDATRA